MHSAPLSKTVYYECAVVHPHPDLAAVRVTHSVRHPPTSASTHRSMQTPAPSTASASVVDRVSNIDLRTYHIQHAYSNDSVVVHHLHPHTARVDTPAAPRDRRLDPPLMPCEHGTHQLRMCATSD